jgi:hypothetical protein
MSAGKKVCPTYTCACTYICRNEFDNIEIHIRVHTHISKVTKFDDIEIHIHVHTSYTWRKEFDNIEWISILSNSFLHIYVHAHVYVGHSFFRLKFYPVERI